MSYYVLNIDPMKEILRTEGRSQTTGLKNALHICRGHFADYRDGRGLFRKHKGVFWVSQHTRGSVTEGVVLKNHAVQAPHGGRNGH